MNLGNLLDELELSSESLEVHRKAIAIYEKLTAVAPTVSRYRHQLAISSNNLGEILLSQDDSAGTETAFRQTLAIRRQLAAEFPAVPEYQRGVAITLSNLGILLKNIERWQDAEEAYRQALAIHEQLAADYPNVVAHQNEVAGAMVNLARILLMRKDPQGARKLLEDALLTTGPRYRPVRTTRRFEISTESTAGGWRRRFWSCRNTQRPRKRRLSFYRRRPTCHATPTLPPVYSQLAHAWLKTTRDSTRVIVSHYRPRIVINR